METSLVMDSAVVTSSLDRSSQSFLQFVRGRDVAVLEKLLSEHSQRAFVQARRMLGSASDAEDAVQEAFLQLVRTSGKFDGRVPFGAWLARLVHGAALHMSRSRMRRARREGVAAVASDGRQAAPDEERYETIRRAVAELPERYRAALDLHYFAGLDQGECAAALGLSVVALKSRIQRGRERLRTRLARIGITATSAAIVEALVAPPAVAGSEGAVAAGISKLTGSIAAGNALPASLLPSIGFTLITKLAVVLPLVLVVSAPLYFYAVATSHRREFAVATDPRLLDILAKKIDCDYRWDSLWAVSADLDMRVGLNIAYPQEVDEIFTLEAKQVTVREVLEKIAAIGGLELEYHENSAVFWKRADDQSLDQLAEQLKNGDVSARIRAVYDLAQLGDKRIYPLLLSALADENDQVIGLAIGSLHSHRTTLYYGRNKTNAEVYDAAGPLLMHQLSLDKRSDSGYRTEPVLLGALRYPRAIDTLIASINSGLPEVRTPAYEALSLSRDQRAVEALITRIAENRRGNEASTALAAMRDPRAADKLIPLLNHPDVKVRQNAAAALARTSDQRALAAMIQLLVTTEANQYDEGEARLRRTVVAALDGCQDAKVIEAIADLLLDTDSVVRQKAAVSLCHAGDRRGFEAVLPLLADPSVQGQIYWAPILASTHDSRLIDSLIALLADPDPKVRSDAAEHLASIRDPRATDVLLARLQDPDADVRSETGWALRYSRDPRVTDALIALFDNPDRNNAESAAKIRGRLSQAWATLRDPRTLDLLLARLNDPDPDVRKSFAEALQYRRTPRAVDALLVLLDDADSSVRSSAVNSLGRIADARSIEPLIALLVTDDQELRNRVMDALAYSGDPRVIEAVVSRLADPDTSMRKGAARALYALLSKGRGLNMDRATDLLIGMLSDPDDDLRYLSASILSIHLSYPRAKAALIPLMTDANAKVRKAAVASLVWTIPEARFIEQLVPLLADPDSETRRTVLGALGRIPDRAMIDILTSKLSDPDSKMRNCAASALIARQDSFSIQAVRTLLSDSDPQIRSCLVATLLRDTSGVKPLESLPQYVDALARLTTDSDAGLRKNVAEVLGKIHDQRAIDALTPLAEDAQAAVRTTAVSALCAQGPLALDALLALAKSPDLDICRLAATGLANMEDSRIFDAFSALLHHSEAKFRAIAARDFGNMRDARVFPEVLERLNDPDPEVRSLLARKVGWSMRRTDVKSDLEGREKRALDALLPLLEDPDSRVRAGAAHGLGIIGSRDLPVIQALIRRLEDPDAKVVDTAVFALEQIPDLRCKEALRDHRQRRPVKMP
jgi:RNA polymerase sigma factor (sigma-70 family)